VAGSSGLREACSFWRVQKEAFEVDGEVIVERRRRWTPEQKAALIAEVEAAGGQVSMVARRHGISASLLYNWRSACKAALAVRTIAARPAEFVQIGVVTDAPGDSLRVPTTAGAMCPRGAGLSLAERVGVIEIDLPDGARVRVDGSVNEKALRRVLSALRGSG
jgi:transposase